MTNKKQAESGEVKTQSEKKTWVTPALEIIGSDDILSGNSSGYPEGKRVGPSATYYS